MPLVTNGRHLYAEVPQGYPVPGKTTVHDESQKIDTDTVPLNGGFLLKTLVLSIDPYIRGRMVASSAGHYVDAFKVGEPLNNYGVGVVLRSEHPDVQPGDHLYGFYTFEEYIIRNNPKEFRKVESKEGLPWSAYVGAVGMPGQTAYLGWKAYARASEGDVVFISTGAGPVGSFVAQIAKRAGLKVIASAGSDEKVKFMKEIGVDVAFNYKTTDTREILEAEGPINIYWDNVGGDTLEAALAAAAPHARFIECGMISGYNVPNAHGIRNLMSIIPKRITMQGFVVTDLVQQHSQDFYDTVPSMVAKGEVKYLEDAKHGLDKAGEALLDVLTGKNHGKSVIIVAEN